MTAAACTQPGCGGTIEDGYCDVCGLAPTTAPPAPVRGAGSPAGGGWAPLGSGGSIRYAGGPAPGAGSGPGVASGGSGSGFSGPSGAGSAGYGSGGSWVTGLGSAGSASGPGTRGSRSGRSGRGRLGAGLVEVPPVPYLDPSSAVLSDPKVPESRRFCGHCGQPVGQARDGRPGMTEGYCPNCRTRYSFSPKLVPGELVAGQYEVLGCLAHGGLGWIYLARDHNVSDRWVVLKGLLNTGDADAFEAAVAEGRFLAKVEHPNIVRIYNFVKHASLRDGETAGYIVMEYVGGKSLKQIRLDARQYGGAVPLAHALAYALEILPAFGYLHDRGLVYCDFKPDNIIQTEEQLKLIDMGGVRYINDDGPIYGTVGYQAPEIETEGPSPSSDLYTVGRTLAVLTFDFGGFQGQNQFRLPDNEPLLLQQESYARLLRRATHRHPARRFQAADEMAEQLTGVLREVLSADDGQPRPAFSALFSSELRAIGTDLSPASANGNANGTGNGNANGTENGNGTGNANGNRATGNGTGNGAAASGAAASGAVAVPPPPAAEVVAGLPVPLADGTDAAAAYLATLAGLEPAQQAQKLLGAVTGDAGVPPGVADSMETRLALARALIGIGDLDQARAALNEMAAPAAGGATPGDWRVAWYSGLCELAGGRPDRAREAFSAVYDELPGELAPKLALGFAAEAAGDLAAARHYFQLVWTIDRSYVSAGFGTARAYLAGGDRVSAIAAVAAVPETSSHHAAAQIAAVRLLVAGGAGLSVGDLQQADVRLGRLSLDDNDPRRHQLAVEILRAALDWVSATPPVPPPGAARATGDRILGYEPNERSLRFGLERGYRALATLLPERRVELVDMANSVRPRTWI
ncbi:MAG TPA: tetratricopeptide repeat protein [Trebonia sp.]